MVDLQPGPQAQLPMPPAAPPTAVMFRVDGAPAAKGSWVPILRCGGLQAIMAARSPAAVLTAVRRSVGLRPQQSVKLTAWTNAVKLAAVAHGVRVTTAPVALTLVYLLAPPKRVLKSSPRRNTPCVTRGRNDLDKLERAVYDALTGVAWEDDAQVWRCRHEKLWAVVDDPGLQIRITEGVE